MYSTSGLMIYGSYKMLLMHAVLRLRDTRAPRVHRKRIHLSGFQYNFTCARGFFYRDQRDQLARRGPWMEMDTQKKDEFV